MIDIPYIPICNFTSFFVSRKNLIALQVIEINICSNIVIKDVITFKSARAFYTGYNSIVQYNCVIVLKKTKKKTRKKEKEDEKRYNIIMSRGRKRVE